MEGCRSGVSANRAPVEEVPPFIGSRILGADQEWFCVWLDRFVSPGGSRCLCEHPGAI